jgi:[acyl-carrier-protein] S-malonyltransferase
MRALVFPGQGSQVIGMGKELSETYPEARAVFEEVDNALGENLSKLIWEGDLNELTLTKNAQPALMATSMATLAALIVEGFTFQDFSFAGHSLGEYSALASVGCLSVEDTAKLLRIRGDAMQNAVPVGNGAMAAILGLDFFKVLEIAKQAAGEGICDVANDNDPSQVVVSGDREAVDRAIKISKDYGAKRALLLPVSAPFHCKLMFPAETVMKEALSQVTIREPKIPIISNINAKPTTDPDLIKKQLVEQVTGTVQWRKSVLCMSTLNVKEIWEIGAGKALSGMVRRIDKSINTRAIIKVQDVIESIDFLNNS